MEKEGGGVDFKISPNGVMSENDLHNAYLQFNA
jgi:hypothetical protein